ncbi:MAG: hypothetical protein AAGI28_04180 [Pseudomonadota bacterium]
MPYNENGRYFDADNAVVFQQQDAAAYGYIALFLAVLAVWFFMLSRRQ